MLWYNLNRTYPPKNLNEMLENFNLQKNLKQIKFEVKKNY